MPDFGKRINQVVNERWDLPDGAASLMQLQADTLARIEAGDRGVAEGVLSRSEVTFETVGPVKQLRLGGCLLYGCKPDDTPSNLSTAAPVVYDPTDPNQTQSTVDITSLDGSEGAIWWSVALAPTDLANRRVWEAGYPDGRNQPILTRETPRVIFQTTSGANFDTPPATGGPWYRFAAVDFNASPPTVVLCHALDFGFEYHAFAVAAGTVSPNYWLGQIALNNRSNSTNVGRSYSVARLLTQMSLSYLQTLDSRLTYDVETCGIVDFSGSTLLTSVDQGIVQLSEQNKANLTWIGTLTWNGGTPGYELATTFTTGAVTVTLLDNNDAWGNNGVRAILTVTPASGFEVIHLSAEVEDVLSDGLGNFQLPATSLSGTLPLSTPFQAEVGAWDPSEAVAADKPTVADVIDVLIYTSTT